MPGTWHGDDRIERMMEHASIATVSGREFYPLAPRVADVDHEDIAHALAMKCRYTGQCAIFYSVAQHSVFVADILMSWGQPLDVQLAGLLHDASEAYLPDVASPVKSHIKGFKEIEGRVLAAVFERYGVEFPMPPVVKDADRESFLHEYNSIMPKLEWATCKLPQERWPRIRSWPPGFGRVAWLSRFYSLIQATRRVIA